MDFRSPEGDRLDPEFWKEKKKVLYFGFSHCPDMCPTALTSFGRASLILGDKANKYRFVFVSLDPERDSPEKLKTYVTGFPGKNLTALSPAPETMKKLHEVFPILHRKVNTNGSYMIDHTNLIFVIDEELNQIASIPGGVSATALAEKLREIDSM
ncbi:SCO family protein [Leptospira idonii]|uniref:SCO family protein n=1 Tax=Leptospira idonii TaxID=1193500 RepID=UPI001FE51B82|nr:SCO family protein [Leptospira idonii]